MRKSYFIYFLVLWCFQLRAQVQTESLSDASRKINEELPEVYDSVTKLRRTTVENNDLKFHFLLNADEKEYNWALPKVKAQVLKSICRSPREKRIFQVHRANVVYSYENLKGQSLGEFMIRPEHCLK